MSGPFVRVRDILRWEGPRGLTARGLGALGYRAGDWYARPLDEPIRPVAPRPGVELGTLSEADLPEYLAFRRGATERQFLGRLRAGHVCFAARRDGKLASVTWVATDTARMEAVDAELTLEPGEAYLYDSFSTPLARGLRLQPTICAVILQRYRAAGFRRAVTLIGPENRPNIASRTRSGFRRTGTLQSVHVGPFHRVWFRGRRAPGPGSGDLLQ
jgi:hypothetical protein